jgi:hypothetical protein
MRDVCSDFYDLVAGYEDLAGGERLAGGDVEDAGGVEDGLARLLGGCGDTGEKGCGEDFHRESRIRQSAVVPVSSR